MADNNYTMDIVKFFRRKSADGFTEPITYLGAEQRFVGALPNSNNNNLEEQFLLGTDTYTEAYLNIEGNQVIEKSFKKDGETTNYYKLVTIIYSEENQKNTDFYFDNDIVYMLNENNSIDYDSVESKLNFEDNDFIVFDVDSQGVGEITITPDTFVILRVDSLYFVDGNENNILVAIKTTQKRYTTDNKEIIKESIENKLN